MPRTKEQYEAMRAATRERIFTAAGELFSKKGLSGTSVQEIADKAGMSIGLLYRHYKTKEALFDALVMDAADGLTELAKRLLSDGSPGEIVRSFCREVVSDVSKNDDFNNTIMLITQAISHETQSTAMDILSLRDREMLAAWEVLIRRGQAEGSFRPGNPHDLALIFCSMLQGISQFRLLLKDDFMTPSAQSLSSILLREGGCQP